MATIMEALGGNSGETIMETLGGENGLTIAEVIEEGGVNPGGETPILDPGASLPGNNGPSQ